jgi:cytochrome c-type biogenesis protein CcmH
MVLVVVVVVVAAARSAPRTGQGDRRQFALASQLKCLQCVGESVGASQAPLAVKFRAEIDRQMRQGRTDDEILNYFAQRYGRQVLETPPATGLGALVWVVPVVAVALAVTALVVTFRRRRSDGSSRAPTAADEALVAAALAARRDGPAVADSDTEGDVSAADRDADGEAGGDR